MRDMNGLDTRLAASRDQLLNEIRQPPWQVVAGRAAVLRRRRHGAIAGTLAAVAAGTLAVPMLLGGAGGGSGLQTIEPPPPGQVYRGGGITLIGLPRAGDAVDLPGTIADVEFVDPDHGYVVTACPSETDCRPAFARTADGGRTWSGGPLPDGVDPGSSPNIVTFPDGGLVLTGSATFVSADGGRSWALAPGADGPPPQAAGPDEVLRSGSGNCGGGPVEVWSPRYGRRGVLANPVPLSVCWVASAPTADGAWWVGGIADGYPALAITSDRGRTWSLRKLSGSGAAMVTFVGRYAYATVTKIGGAELRGILASSDDGAHFTPMPDAGGRPSTVVGEPVPMLDGRLLISSKGYWFVSSDDGMTFENAGGDLPAVGRIARTSAGYVAYDLFTSGWAAFSSDGSTWHKLLVH